MLPSIDQPTRVEVCPVCALVYSMPLDFYLARVKDNGAIHCPAGHALVPSADKALVTADALVLCIDLQSQLKQARAELERTRAYIARLPQPPEGPIDDAEFKRRVDLLTHRAERVEYGKTLCRFCGKQKAGTGGCGPTCAPPTVMKSYRCRGCFFD